MEKNIALLTPTFCEYSGIDRVVEWQAKELRKNNSDVTVFALDATIQLQGIPVVILGMPRSLFLQRIYRLFFFFDFIKIIHTVKRLRNFDLIYSHLYPMNVLALFAKLFYHKNFIFYNHGVAPAFTFRTVYEKIYITIFRFFNNLTASFADEIISISQYLADVFQKETGKKSKIRYNTINIQRFHKVIDGSIIRKKYHLEHQPIILYVGRISPHKGVHLLIEAFELLLQKIPHAYLFIVGAITFPDYFHFLKKISPSHTIFTDAVSDTELPLYYAAANVYASCSLWEGFNLPLAEARACGKPVVVFDLPVHRELKDKEIALVQSYKIDSFAEALNTNLHKYSEFYSDKE